MLPQCHSECGHFPRQSLVAALQRERLQTLLVARQGAVGTLVPLEVDVRVALAAPRRPVALAELVRHGSLRHFLPFGHRGQPVATIGLLLLFLQL